MTFTTAHLNHIIEAAHAGGGIQANYFGKQLELNHKNGLADLYTVADTESEEVIITLLKKHFPDFSFYAEESGFEDNASAYTFYIDPLDGSHNFVMGIPLFSVSIGLVREGEIIAGVIHNPITGVTWSALTGEGAWRNGERIHVAKEHNGIQDAVIGYTRGYGSHSDRFLYLAEALEAHGVQRMTTFWSPAQIYGLISTGTMHAMVNDNNDLYDFMAGKVILQEAGAVLSDFSGNPLTSFDQREFLATCSQGLTDELVHVLAAQ